MVAWNDDSAPEPIKAGEILTAVYDWLTGDAFDSQEYEKTLEPIAEPAPID